MRWAPTSSFKDSNRELLALYVCRDMAVFVVHKSSQEVPGVPGASLGRLRDFPGVPGACPGVLGASGGVPGACPGLPGASPGVPGACPGDPQDPRWLQERPGHPQDSFHKDDSVI